MEPIATGRDADAFWAFSLRFYSLPAVPQTCIELQDNADADVNILLYLLFLARAGHAVAVEDAARMDAAVASWRKEVVHPLRCVRRALTGSGDTDVQALRDEVKRSELSSERIEQRVLVRACPLKKGTGPGVAPLATARLNIAAYGAHLGRDFPEAVLTTLLASFESV